MSQRVRAHRLGAQCVCVCMAAMVASVFVLAHRDAVAWPVSMDRAKFSVWDPVVSPSIDVLRWGAPVASATTAGASTPLPNGWAARDVGAPGFPGRTIVAGDEFTVAAGGRAISGKADEFHYVYIPVQGDVDVIARLTDVQRASAMTAGLMIRESLDPKSAHAFVFNAAGTKVHFRRRPAPGAKTAQTSGPAGSVPGWLKLERRGSTISAHASADGQVWALIANADVDLPSSAYVGLAVASGQATTFSVAAFDEVVVHEVPSAAVPNDWDARDIGGPAFEGRSIFENGTFAIAAGGKDIGGKADQFHYVYTPAAGDVDVIARLATTERHTSMKAGVMIRASLDAKSPHAFMFTSATKRFDFRRRLVTGGKTKQATGNPAGIPSWVKLERRGALVSAYSSLDGNTWTFVGNELMELPASFLVGLAVSGGSSTPFAVAAFDRVEVRTTQPAPALEPPAPTPPKPTPSKPKPSKPVSPAEDPRPAPSVPQPRRIVFEPSSDHHTKVKHYTLEVVGASAPSVTLLEENLGKPSILNGECTVDVAAVLGGLPPGKYIAIVRAANAEGRSAGATASFEVSR